MPVLKLILMPALCVVCPQIVWAGFVKFLMWAWWNDDVMSNAGRVCSSMISFVIFVLSIVAILDVLFGAVSNNDGLWNAYLADQKIKQRLREQEAKAVPDGKVSLVGGDHARTRR